MKRKHTVVVEVTFDKPITGKAATRLVKDILDGMSVEQAVYETSVRHDAEATHVQVKDGARVFAALNREKDLRTPC